MRKREAEMQRVWKHYVIAKWPRGKGNDAVFELKREVTNRMPVSNVDEHQNNALDNAQNAFLYYKIPDDSRGYKPFDCAVWTGTPSYLVISFGEHLTEFILIPFTQWQQWVNTGAKSITRDYALSIGEKITIPKK